MSIKPLILGLSYGKRGGCKLIVIWHLTPWLIPVTKKNNDNNKEHYQKQGKTRNL